MQRIKTALIGVGGLTGLALLLSVWIPFVEAFRAVFGGFYVVMVPGLAMTFALFRNKELNWLERLPFGFALSMVSVPLVVFSLSHAGVSVNAITTLLVTTGLTGMALILFYIRNRKTT